MTACSIEVFAADQIVVCDAEIHLDELQVALAKHGQCLPLPDVKQYGIDLAGRPGALNEMLDRNLPHGLEAQCGSWRDWVLGISVRLPDGAIAKCGSRVVKNVAGYDVMKLFIGARGELGAILNATLRTYPIASIPTCQGWVRNVDDVQPTNWVQRVLRTDFQTARASVGDSLQACDKATSTLWAREGNAPSLPRRFSNDWVIHNDAPLLDPLSERFRQRAIAIFRGAA